MIFDILFSKKQEEVKKESEPSMFGSLNSGLDETFLFDFKNWGTQYGNSSNGFLGIGTPIEFSGNIEFPNNSSTNTVDNQKIAIKPIDALLELEIEPNPFTLAGIVEKIQMLKHKEHLIVQHYAKREVTALIERLENRKKYVEFKGFFDGFQYTTDEKIDKLLEKYDHLTMKTSDIFVPEFPDEAINIMNSYSENMHELCGKKPVFYVIAPKHMFEKAYQKRDPILLVQSPFCFKWQILGAWDEEMLILGEL